MTETLQFQPKTFFKFVNKDENNYTDDGPTVYKIGLNDYETRTSVNSKKLDCIPPYIIPEKIWYIDIDGLPYYDRHCNEYIMIVKIPVGVPIKKSCNTYKSPIIFVESIHLYTDFLTDNTIVPEIKKTMKEPDLRMGIFQIKENLLEAVKNSSTAFNTVKNLFTSKEIDKWDSEFLKKICLEAVKKDGCQVVNISSFLLNKEDPKWDPDFAREICLEAVKNNGYTLRYVPPGLVNIDICLEAVKNKGMAIEYVPPTLIDRHLCLEAVKNNGMAIGYVPSALIDRENPEWDPDFARKICLEAVKKCGKSIMYIPLALIDKEICLEAVKNNGQSIFYIKPPYSLDREICLEAVKRDGHSIIWILPNIKDDETDFLKKVCLAAVKQYAFAICEINEKKKELLYSDVDFTKHLCLTAVKKDPKVIRQIFYIKCSSTDFLKEVCLTAVKKDGNVFQYIDNYLSRDVDIRLAAVSNHGFAIRFIHFPEKEVCMAAVKQNGNAIKFIQNQIFEVCEEAVKRCKTASFYIPKIYREKLDLKYGV